MVISQSDNTHNGWKLLASLRQKSGLTQVELANKADVSRSMIAQLESGERRPSQKLIQALCRSMEVTLDADRQLLLSYHLSPSGHTPEQIEHFLRTSNN